MAWTFEDKFNSDTKSTGDLASQDGWNACDPRWDVVTTTPYDGDQCVTVIFEGGTTPTYTLGADVSAGIVYVALKFNSNVIAGGDFSFYLRDTSAANRARVGMSGGNLNYSSAASTNTTFAAASAGQWYLFEIEVNASAQARFRYHNGTSWSVQTGWCAAYAGSGTDVRSVNLNAGSGGDGASQTWIDYISPTNPLAGGSTPYRRRSNLALMGVS